MKHIKTFYLLAGVGCFGMFMLGSVRSMMSNPSHFAEDDRAWISLLLSLAAFAIWDWKKVDGGSHEP